MTCMNRRELPGVQLEFTWRDSQEEDGWARWSHWTYDHAPRVGETVCIVAPGTSTVIVHGIVECVSWTFGPQRPIVEVVLDLT